MNENTFLLAKLIHEERVEEALQRQRHQLPREEGQQLLPVLLQSLGGCLIALGKRLNADAAPSLQTKQA